MELPVVKGTSGWPMMIHILKRGRGVVGRRDIGSMGW